MLAHYLGLVSAATNVFQNEPQRFVPHMQIPT